MIKGEGTQRFSAMSHSSGSDVLQMGKCLNPIGIQSHSLVT